MKRKLYMIGQITADPITYKWRTNIEEHVRELPPELRSEFELINPCGNSFSQKVLETAKLDHDEFTKSVIDQHVSNILPPQDCGFVMYSNGCIANLNHYSPERPLLGTIYELAWYYLMPWKPVVAIFNGNPEDDQDCRHPFVWKTVHTWVKDEYEAIQVFVNLYCK